MTLRCTIQRDQTATTNAWNTKAKPNYQNHLTDVACWFWTTTKREDTDAQREAVIQDVRMMIPLGTDVTETDRINGITDRRGNSVVSGVFDVEAVVKHHLSHLELVLKKVS